jgi:hypothetical protein
MYELPENDTAKVHRQLKFLIVANDSDS